MSNQASNDRTSADSSFAKSALRLLFGSPVLWGLTASGAFYAAIPYLPKYRESAQRYFCSHPLEYALIVLFFIGLSILGGRLLRLVRERRALATNVLDRLSERAPSGGTGSDADFPKRVEFLNEALQSLPARDRDSFLVARCRAAGDFLQTRPSGRGLEEHLKYLAETAVERLFDSYSLLLTINWAVPIIGFLGTVVGITLAIANVTPEQLDTSLNNVTGGLAVAFDTTTVAMSFSLVLVFAYDWIKRTELRILAQVEQISLQQLLPMFLTEETATDPVQQAQASAARQLLDRTESLIQDQTTLWQDSLDGMRQRWSETIDTQQQQLSTHLHQGVESTLSEHADQLAQVRGDFLSAFETASTRFQEALEFDAARRDLQDEQSQSQQQKMWDRIHEGLQEVVRSHDARTEDLLDGFSERMQQWQAALEQSSQSVETHMQTLAEYTDRLAQLAAQGDQLGRVERQLADNLEAVRAAETFEETLHNLTAAVHMLTARAKPKAA